MVQLFGTKHRHLVRVGGDIRVTELIDLHEAEDGDQVHEGRVKLD